MERGKGARTRSQILDIAAEIATEQGLGPLSLGRLAAGAGLSKSGVFAHFGSKEELQLATVRAAAREFEERVVAATEEAEPGLARLRALVEAWIDHVERAPRRGGCFFFATSAEYAGRTGRVRDALALATGAWLRLLEREARTAVRTGELDARPELLAFRLHAYVQEANWQRQLLGAPDAFDRARDAVRAALAEAGAPPPRSARPRRRSAARSAATRSGRTS